MLLGADGAVGSVGGEDVELQRIFDELFEDFEFPVDVDRFCNEVIEEGIVATSDKPGARQIGTAEQKPSEGGNRRMPAIGDDGKQQSTEPAQIIVQQQQPADKVRFI